MSSQPHLIRIPLLEISGKVQRETSVEKFPKGLKPVSELEINITQSISNQDYALEIVDIAGKTLGSGSSLAVFGREKDIPAMKDVYIFGLEGQEPLVCKVIKNDAQPGSLNPEDSSRNQSASGSINRRKSFMTPTPLHIPESRVSPIPDSTHEMIYLKDLNENEGVKVVPLQKVVWMHPLKFVVTTP